MNFGHELSSHGFEALRLINSLISIHVKPLQIAYTIFAIASLKFPAQNPPLICTQFTTGSLILLLAPSPLAAGAKSTHVALRRQQGENQFHAK